MNGGFIDIGQNVKLRREPLQILQANLTDIEIELLAYRLRFAPERGDRVEGTVLQQIEFPVKKRSLQSWFVVYLADKSFSEIFIISISPQPLILVDAPGGTLRFNEVIMRIGEAAIRLFMRA
ncbi:hypothetical protein [Rhodomicrobium udaipurense]|uniref:Uncharacterized protein n=1 Tax=Rhodomicrobium udaipurense TaxID=1202716 RepID=A0A8I1KKD0_9HYPH|nr:hypothetical protein [Rhodomicrobium udaipurense]MBJ7544827.1 hypothetical protein [Rhodomicrobium udaipurense]